MSIAGIIIAGGSASRMGMDKPFATFCGRYLIDAVIDRALPQVGALMFNVRPEHTTLCRTRYGSAYALVADEFDGKFGPLGGVVAGLRELPSIGAPWLATFPCDTPFLPKDIVRTLHAAAVDAPVVAIASGKMQSLCALWPRHCLEALRDGVASGIYRSVWRALDAFGAVRVDVSAVPHAFFNINTPADLSAAERLALGDCKQT